MAVSSLSSCSELALSLPYRSLQAGQWVKLICGASYQDMPTIRRLAMVYALAGVDCVDVAADVAVVAAARRGLADAVTMAKRLEAQASQAVAPWGSALPQSPPFLAHLLENDLPWLMVSLNDSEDPHFRKAFFDAVHCPPACPRPCETICPTAAIHFADRGQGGVIPNLCYGCGRCIAVCPVENIVAQSHLAQPEDFLPETLNQVDAVEIHTRVGRQREFAALWQRLEPWRAHIKLVSVSCPEDPHIVDYLRDLHRIMDPLTLPLIWQTDGRPMSGDLGKGTTHATLRLAQTVLAADLPGYVQLAGGTNAYTVPKLRELGLLKGADPLRSPLTESFPTAPHPWVAGIAYGSYARTLMMPLLETLEPYLEPWLQPWPQRPDSEPWGPHPAASKSQQPAAPAAESLARLGGLDALVAAIDQAWQLVGAMKQGQGIPPPRPWGRILRETADFD